MASWAFTGNLQYCQGCLKLNWRTIFKSKIYSCLFFTCYCIIIIIIMLIANTVSSKSESHHQIERHRGREKERNGVDRRSVLKTCRFVNDLHILFSQGPCSELKEREWPARQEIMTSNITLICECQYWYLLQINWEKVSIWESRQRASVWHWDKVQH